MAQHAFAVGHARAAHGVGDKGDFIGALEFINEFQKLRRKVLSVGDDFNRHIVNEIGRFDHADIAVSVFAVNGAHAGIKVGNVCEARVIGVFDFVPFRV